MKLGQDVIHTQLRVELFECHEKYHEIRKAGSLNLE